VQNAEDLMAKERLGWFRGNQPASGDKPAAKEE
jgi:hypothetical protein